MTLENYPLHKQGIASSGVSTVDPLLNTHLGLKLKFKSLDFRGSDGGVLPQAVINGNFFQGAILALGLNNIDGSQIIGSAILIGPGLAVTATHVLREVFPELVGGVESLFLLGPRVPKMDIWIVSSISFSEEDDVSYLSIELRSELPSKNSFGRFGIRVKPPQVGETVNIVGYRFDRSKQEISQEEMQASFHGDLLTARGEIEEFLPGGRDRVLLPGSCFQIACSALGGMSGGAVLDDQGLLLGILSTSMGGEEDRGPTFASWLPSGFNRMLKLSWPPGMFPSPIHLLDIHSAAIEIEGRDRISTQNIDGTIHITISID